jgi:hypothetical protein
VSLLLAMINVLEQQPLTLTYTNATWKIKSQQELMMSQ